MLQFVYMETNNLYNLMMQITEDSKSVWRIKKHYLKESKTSEMKSFWTKVMRDKENHLKELKDLIKKELK